MRSGNRAAEEPLIAGSDHGNAALQAAEYNRRSHRRSFRGLPGHRLGDHHRIHSADSAGYRRVPAGRGGGEADDPGPASAGRRHVVAMLVMGARPRDVGWEIEDYRPWQPDYRRRIREYYLRLGPGSRM